MSRPQRTSPDHPPQRSATDASADPPAPQAPASLRRRYTDDPSQLSLDLPHPRRIPDVLGEYLGEYLGVPPIERERLWAGLEQLNTRLNGGMRLKHGGMRRRRRNRAGAARG